MQSGQEAKTCTVCVPKAEKRFKDHIYSSQGRLAKDQKAKKEKIQDQRLICQGRNDLQFKTKDK